MTRRQAVSLLDRVIGSQPNLDRIAAGVGRVATTAHPDCTCWPRRRFDENGRVIPCGQHAGVRAGARYVQPVLVES